MSSSKWQANLTSRSVRWGVALLAAAFAAELLVGFRLGETAGSLAEAVMALSLVAAGVLVFAQLGRSRKFVAAGLAFASVMILWGLNAAFSTSLDVAYGGEYGWSQTRVAVLAWLVGPVIASVTAILTFGFAYFRKSEKQIARSISP
jgi:hypothetical protein